MIEVISPGLFTLIQDLGRNGFYSIGMPPSGALDQYSHSIANLLVGNDSSAATLELTYIAPKLVFKRSATVAVTGADLDVYVDGQEVEPWTTLIVGVGQTLSFGRMRTGSRAYISVRGGISSAPFLGSRSTYVNMKIGGLAGTQLKVGDILPIGLDAGLRPPPTIGTVIEKEFRPALAGAYELRVVEGLCNYRFAREGLEKLFASDYGVTPESNRTGYRLSGPHLGFVDREPVFGAGSNPSNVVDLGYPMGSIQVPNGEEPICLLRDAVTGGGYATLGTVISVDLDLLAQAKTPDTVSFTRIGIAEALAERQTRNQKLARLADHVQRAR